MIDDVDCPYCGEGQEIYHDDGQNYEEDRLHEQCCSDCDKTFTFYTSMQFYYEAFQADCLNDSNHTFKPTYTHPKFLTKMECTSCEEKRQLTEHEWLDLNRT